MLCHTLMSQGNYATLELPCQVGSANEYQSDYGFVGRDNRDDIATQRANGEPIPPLQSLRIKAYKKFTYQHY